MFIGVSATKTFERLRIFNFWLPIDIFSKGQKNHMDKGLIFNTTITVCPRSLDPIYVITYYIRLTKTSWTKQK